MLPNKSQTGELAESAVIVIPVHIGKANWFAAFLQSYKMFGYTPIIAVVSSEGEGVFFENLTRILGVQVEIVCATNLLEPFMEDPQALLQSTNAIVIIKKFIGLSYALERYNYALAFDCDSMLIGKCNWVEAAIENYHNKVFLGKKVHIENFNRINKHSRLIIDPNKKIPVLDDVIDIYSWFMDPPVYRRDDFSEFRTYCCDLYGGWVEFLSKLRWEAFEHIVYQYFLVSQKGWSIKDYSRIASDLPENLRIDCRQRIALEFNHKPVWTSMITCLSPQWPDNQGICLCFHVDRSKPTH